MQEKMIQQTSLLFDDELDQEQALSIYETIGSDAEMQALWRRYHTIRQNMRQDRPIVPTQDFAARIQHAIEQEPILSIAPQRARPTRFVFAMAASIALLGIVVMNYLPSFNEAANPVVTMAKVGAARLTKQQVVDPRLNEYLMAHQESSQLALTQAMLPYARVVSFSSGQ